MPYLPGYHEALYLNAMDDVTGQVGAKLVDHLRWVEG